ncbi:MAG: MBL fold metallo-hydrolase [Muribaculaceae bacterium]|nr:MBL fold metallo-hydrolase [Muribaculaceae bacterium]
MNIKSFKFNMFGLNTYVVWDIATRKAMIIDPGMINEAEEHKLDTYIKDNNIEVTHLVNTHLHLDHTFGNDHVKRKYALPLQAHEADAPLGLTRAEQCRRFGLRGNADPVIIDKKLSEGDLITLGNTKFEVLHIPGHSPGSIVLYDSADSCIFVGDVLFQRSIGRTDLPGGNHVQLINGIRSKLLTLPPDTIVYPGHGPATTIGEELYGNPFV